ncbi:hypothetical protein U1Q18_027960 [Sarracenia purpurea var. burkii]
MEILSFVTISPSFESSPGVDFTQWGDNSSHPPCHNSSSRGIQRLPVALSNPSSMAQTLSHSQRQVGNEEDNIVDGSLRMAVTTSPKSYRRQRAMDNIDG